MDHKKQVTLMTDKDAELLQEAGDDVAYLTSQGYTPTEAIAKVASAAQFPASKTNLLIYAYNNGMAEEKRACLGGPFERLAEFAIPDPKEIHRLVYGTDTSNQQKTASVTSDSLPSDMAMFDKDISGMSREDIRSLFGLGPQKTASEAECIDEKDDPKHQSLSILRTTIQIGISPGDKKSASGHQALRDTLGGVVPKEVWGDLEPTLLGLLKAKKTAMCAANMDAEKAFANVQAYLDTLGGRLSHRHLEPTFKRAGLASVNAYYPTVASLLKPYVGEVDAFLIKESSYDATEVTIHHPWVKEAEVIQKELEAVADLTVLANRKSAEYEAVCHLYKCRDEIRKSANWSSFLAGSLTGPNTMSGVKGLLFGQDQSGPKASARKDVMDDLDDQMHELDLQDLSTRSMLSDFTTHDDILKAYSQKQLMSGYNDLLKTAPKTMRNKATARAMLQQYLTQGRMAPTEFMPALQMNKLDPHKDSIDSKEKKKDD